MGVSEGDGCLDGLGVEMVAEEGYAGRGVAEGVESVGVASDWVLKSVGMCVLLLVSVGWKYGKGSSLVIEFVRVMIITNLRSGECIVFRDNSLSHLCGCGYGCGHIRVRGLLCCVFLFRLCGCVVMTRCDRGGDRGGESGGDTGFHRGIVFRGNTGKKKI